MTSGLSQDFDAGAATVLEASMFGHGQGEGSAVDYAVHEIRLLVRTQRLGRRTWCARDIFGRLFFGNRSRLSVNSGSVSICTETASMAWEIRRAKSDSDVSVHCDQRPMA
jgi:hypothetical protein